MGKVRFGIHIYTADTIQKTIAQVKLAEELGLDTMWLLDSQLVGRELYTTMVASAQQTTKIKIASGVTVPYTRHPTVTACAFATLHELDPGRFILGMGRGDSAVLGIGVQPSSMRQFRGDVDMIRRLLGGESVEYNGKDIRLMFLDPADSPRVPIYLAVGGPQGLRLAYELADGVILHCPPNEQMIDRRLEMVRQAAAEAGKNVNDLDVLWWTHTSIGDDWEAVKEHIRPKMARRLGHSPIVDLESVGLKLGTEARKEAKEAYNFEHHASAVASHGYVADWIPDPVWKELALLGNAEEVGERVKQVLERHPEITHFVIDPPVAGFGLTYESIMTEFATKVIPHATAGVT